MVEGCSEKVAWLFPGQGSQYVGMASEWAERYSVARHVLDEASDVLGFDLAGLIAGGPEETLADTYNQQPAVLAASVAVLRAAAEELPPPAFVAGHSLGEYSALVAAGSLSYGEALVLVRERGRLMRKAGSLRPGRMAAVLGLDDEVVERTCAAIDGAQVANYNAPGQVVISGTRDGVDAACDALDDAGAKRIVSLPITIAAHSTLMDSVSDEFSLAIEDAAVAEAEVPAVANTSAQPITSARDIRAELRRQLTSCVRWTDTVEFMMGQGVTCYYEVGPGKVLTGLLKRIARAGGFHLEVARSLDTPVD